MYTYIIIDDEKIIREGTIKKLSSFPGEISCIGEADNGADGIDLVNNLHPDVIILDMQMPVMDGSELLQYLSKQYPDIPLIVISGFKDFDYIKDAISANAIDYILKPFDKATVQKAMADAIKKIEDKNNYNALLTNEMQVEATYFQYDIQLLENLILGYPTNSNTLSSHKLQYINTMQNFFLITLHFDDTKNTLDLNDFILENNFDSLSVYLPNSYNTQLGFLLVFLPHPTQSYSIQIALSAIEWITAHNASSIAGISNIHPKISMLHEAYLETVTALNHQQFHKAKPLYYLYSTSSKQCIFFWEHEEEFLFRVEAGMPDDVRLLIESLFTYYATIPDCTLEDIKIHIYQLYNQCYLIMNRYIDHMDHQNTSSSTQNIMNGIFSLEELKKYVIQFFINITTMLKSQSVYAIDDTIEKIKIYIQQNYYKNLTQDFISSLFSLNRSYLSALFRKKTGDKFIDYVNKVRIEHAKELLSTTDKKMYQISKAVGYDNTKYFFRIFKKFEKTTPEEYRKRIGRY